MTKIEMQKEIEKLTAENKKLKKFYMVGSKLSNVAYNYGQSASCTDPDLKDILWKLCKEWDEILGIL